MSSIANTLIDAARELAAQVGRLKFGSPVAFVYNPLEYAWDAHQQYLRRFAASSKRVLFLGMNPGPFGMMQTGVPFGEVAAVRDWLHVSGRVESPRHWHPSRPVEG